MAHQLADGRHQDEVNLLHAVWGQEVQAGSDAVLQLSTHGSLPQVAAARQLLIVLGPLLQQEGGHDAEVAHEVDVVSPSRHVLRVPHVVLQVGAAHNKWFRRVDWVSGELHESRELKNTNPGVFCGASLCCLCSVKDMREESCLQRSRIISLHLVKAAGLWTAVSHAYFIQSLCLCPLMSDTASLHIHNLINDSYAIYTSASLASPVHTLKQLCGPSSDWSQTADTACIHSFESVSAFLVCVSHLDADHEPPAALRDVHGLQHGTQAVRVGLELAQGSGAAVLHLDGVVDLEAAHQVVNEGGLAQATLTCNKGGGDEKVFCGLHWRFRML